MGKKSQKEFVNPLANLPMCFVIYKMPVFGMISGFLFCLLQEPLFCHKDFIALAKYVREKI